MAVLSKHIARHDHVAIRGPTSVKRLLRSKGMSGGASLGQIRAETNGRRRTSHGAKAAMVSWVGCVRGQVQASASVSGWGYVFGFQPSVGSNWFKCPVVGYKSKANKLQSGSCEHCDDYSQTILFMFGNSESGLEFWQRWNTPQSNPNMVGRSLWRGNLWGV